MRITPMSIPDVLLIDPVIFHDERGYFLESFNRKIFQEALGHEVDFVQDNCSHSIHRVLRGLHYQLQQPQGKLIRVSQGEIYDVAVDLRQDSPTFGRWCSAILSAQNHRQLWIPEGFAHGFYTLSQTADVHYKITAFWYPAGERTLLWNDPTLAIDWPLSHPPIVSAKDAKGKWLSEAEI
jgi:dTDP-4-dehydrorhamnose 3,5-epimerase